MPLLAEPRTLALTGTLVIAFSSILVRLSHASPSTAAIFRCAYALPLLGLLAWREARRFGGRSLHQRLPAYAAGLFLAADLVCWHRSIEDVGAGLATVLGNLQVAFVPFVAWAALGERPGRRVLAALPVLLAGVLLVSGVVEHGAYGRDPLRGAIYGAVTGLAYAGFILLLRAGGADLRRSAGPLFDATLTATGGALVAGLALGDAHLVPAWPQHAWLVTLALTSQVLGWLLLTTSMPRLPAAVGSMLLTLQPVGSVALAALLLGEAPTALQLVGVAAILAAVLGTAAPSASRRRRTPL